MAWNGSAQQETARDVPPKQPSKGRGLIAGGIAGAIGLLVILIMRPEDETPHAEKAPEETRAIAQAQPAVVRPVEAKPKAEPVKPASTNSPKWEAAKGLDSALFPYKDGRKVLSSFTNNWNQIVDICMMPNGRSRKVIRNAKPPVFEHATDQLIAVALSGDGDSELPPLPIGDSMEAEFLESLNTPIVIKEDDSDAIRRAKENVIEARKIIDAELRKGRSFKSILEEHLAERKGNAEMRQTAMQAVRELQAEGDSKAVNDYIEKVNGLFREKGIGEISSPADNPRRRRK